LGNFGVIPFMAHSPSIDEFILNLFRHSNYELNIKMFQLKCTFLCILWLCFLLKFLHTNPLDEEGSLITATRSENPGKFLSRTVCPFRGEYK
jgi:hypothetical protein